MSSHLITSPVKKRAPSSEDETITTPKRLRIESLVSLAATIKSHSTTSPFLPSHLTRLQTIHTSLQHAISVALARSAVSPSVDTGRVPNVLDHMSLSTAMGFTLNCDINDIKRLCWLWEWNGESHHGLITSNPKVAMDDDDNPFLVPDAPSDWTRGAMGFVITPTTHFVHSEGKRVPAYGIGIEVEMDLAAGKGGGMAAVARWTAEGDSRKRAVEAKLHAWVKMNAGETVPALPLADLPTLPPMSKISSLTKNFLKSGSRSPQKSLTPHPVSAKRTPREFLIPFPVTPQTPSTSPSKSASALDLRASRAPQTPSRQKGPGAATEPQTPTTSRRAALYERIRQKSLTSTPTGRASEAEPISKDKMRLLGQAELKRRCILGRLDEVAATVWALFASHTQTSSTPLSLARKRRTMQIPVVVRALVSSATVPISEADAQESLKMLMTLCPFFLRPLVIAGEDWLEMPAANTATPRSPSPRDDSANEILSRSPKSVKPERGGLREVRERIRRELESSDSP